MKIIVCIKQVPDTTEIRIDPVKGTLMRDGVPSILNPDDANALEAALQIKDEYPGTVVDVVTMGPQQASYALRECLAMGADDAYLLSSRAFGGADTCSTSTTLAYGIKKIGDYDFIFAGRQAIDGDTAQVGPQIAEKLNLPQISYAADIKVEGNKVVVKRMLEDGFMMIEAPTPCLITCIKELNEPRYMSVGGIVDCYSKPMDIYDYEALKDDPLNEKDTIGLEGSPTNILTSFTPPQKGAGMMLEGDDAKTCAEMAGILLKKQLI
mgnify:CR=1 FL=1